MIDKYYDVVVIGAGAAGMMAALAAAKQEKSVLVIEQKKQEGSKILVSGRGRCNITNECDIEDFMKAIMSNKRFMYSSLNTFGPMDVISFFNSIGIETVTERGKRVFPASQSARDIRDGLVKQLKKFNVVIVKNHKVQGITPKSESTGFYINTQQGPSFACNNVILATGGKSLSATGSDGSGYELARSLGHNITRLSGALTGLITKEKWVKDVSGLTLKNISLKLYENDKMLFKQQGELLFTHFGISGPLVLTGSRYLLDTQYVNAKAVIDLKPALDNETLLKRIVKDFEEAPAKQFSNSLDALLPKSLIPQIVHLSGIDESKIVNQITKVERQKLVDVIKNLTLNVVSGQDIEQAVVTKGGVDVKQVNPKTMESKLVNGLFFAGEILDVDALTGGYNLTIAFSTGYLAGMSTY